MKVSDVKRHVKRMAFGLAMTAGITTTSSLHAGPVDPACTTIGSVGTSGACNGLLIVNRAMLEAVAHHLVTGGDSSYQFTNGSTYDGHAMTATYGMGDLYTANVTDMSDLFNRAGWFNPDVENWDVSNVTDMSNMFLDAHMLDRDLSGWDVSNVTNMAGMFTDAKIFTSDISGWNTSKVTDMRDMFKEAAVFTTNIGGWDVSKVENMDSMFESATAFNGDIERWTTASLTSIDYIFKNATSFNRPIGSWNVQNLRDLWHTFEGATAFNQDISTWDTAFMTTLTNTFLNATAFNQSLGTWDTGNVREMNGTFQGASSFNHSLSGWDVCSVTSHTDFDTGAGFTAAGQLPMFPPSATCAGGSAQLILASPTGALVDDDVIDLGTVPAGTTVSVTITVINLGSLNLGIYQSDDGGQAETNIASSLYGVPGAYVIGPESSTTFTVQLMPNAAGFFSLPVEMDHTLDASDPINLTLIGIATGSETGTDTPNNPPIAQAGIDQSVQPGATVALDGSDSRDPDGDTLSYAWLQIEGDAVSLTNPSSAAPSFVVPSAMTAQVLTFRLTVSDPSQASGSDELSITVEKSKTEQAHQAAATLGASVIGGTMAHMSDHVASTRIEERFRQRQNQSGFTALSKGPASGWTAYNSDTSIAALEGRYQSQSADKLDGLDPALTAGLFGSDSQAWGGGRNWDLYTAGGWGGLDRDGPGDYEGFARYTTLGLDYFVSDSLLIGANLNYEWAEIDFAADINGDLAKQGWRVDGYAGWEIDDSLFVEAVASYADLENQIVANFDKGDTGSTRWTLIGKVTGELSGYGADLKPFASLSWIDESFDAYQTDAGVQIEAFDTQVGRSIAGFEISSTEPVLFGLSPSIGAQFEWDFQTAPESTLADGSLFQADIWGTSYRMGLSGQITDFAPQTWLGQHLDGANLILDYTQTSLGREDRSSRLNWSLKVPLF